ncbi:hypothetical protein H6G41_20640 [Tolypothrix sp. FACHB-123]|uniref:hypothetical protein n=1 Tax=Tolypothrix sp. FACHB-123 TaxID=2692868 RepID=UPI0016871BEA|nr:hypothetical protein [Tolypothrix sp. FACHB-123]MBD2357005.1 hypothetical protein [Tolypothrix sp. FACHB-123]
MLLGNTADGSVVLCDRLNTPPHPCKTHSGNNRHFTVSSTYRDELTVDDYNDLISYLNQPHHPIPIQNTE